MTKTIPIETIRNQRRPSEKAGKRGLPASEKRQHQSPDAFIILIDEKEATSSNMPAGDKASSRRRRSER